MTHGHAFGPESLAVQGALLNCDGPGADGYFVARRLLMPDERCRHARARMLATQTDAESQTQVAMHEHQRAHTPKRKTHGHARTEEQAGESERASEGKRDSETVTERHMEEPGHSCMLAV